MENKQIPLGLNLPIRNSNSGYFECTYDTLEQRKVNIINLLNTKIGERRMQPNFGSGLWDLVFENYDTVFIESITLISIFSV